MTAKVTSIESDEDYIERLKLMIDESEEKLARYEKALRDIIDSGAWSYECGLGIEEWDSCVGCDEKLEIARDTLAGQESPMCCKPEVQLCPVCGGSGNVPPGFYQRSCPLVDGSNTAIPQRETCLRCAGIGTINRD